MTNRRQLLNIIPAAFAAGLAGTSAARAANAEREATQMQKPNVIEPGVRDAFPDVGMIDQFGQSHQLYDDLIKNNVVLLNFMSIRDESSLGITAKLSQLATTLGDKITDRKVQMISITRDPHADSPALLKAFAQAHGAPAQWLFLTGTRQNSEDLALRMYRMKHAHMPGARKVDIVFYGNGSAGVWGGFPVDIQVADMAERVTWVMPRPAPLGTATRAGPRKYNAADPRNHNRQA